MLAVVLVPLSLLIIACLMERLEARVAPTATVRLAPRRITAAAGDAAPRSTGRHLRVLPAAPDTDDDEPLRRAG